MSFRKPAMISISNYANCRRKDGESKIAFAIRRSLSLPTPNSLAYHDFLDRMQKVAEQIGFIETALQVLDGLPKYGRKAKDEWYDDLLDECLNDAGRVKKDVRRLFLERRHG